ncbi:hypothetical protein BCR33DRAFT_245585 [Rhizoclosmatium globosum]|uniref:CIP2A N-terminal domain-containing protein n=1 Tax=Rhizoclosmatium globosum TaxID=329046 RepID=A0A1Y2C9E1_9FUNG|nr:hypothetical protein BCR33DRAFT_245585 [Rhizoclosmatium globosum]|eukprot:ORY43652.1 hypothetical protein BCR33DRAFT_245585 [Rhizoclosmatium globosum]
MLSGSALLETQGSQADVDGECETETVRDGLLFAAASSSQSAAQNASAALRKKVGQLAAALGKQRLRLRRRSTAIAIANQSHCHVGPDTRLLLESIAADAVRLPSVFVRTVASPALCAPLLAGLLQIMHDVDPDSRIMAHALQLALLLFKDKELRRLFLDMGSFDVLAAKVPLLRENLSLVLQFIEAATRITILPTCNESNSLIVFLQNNISSPSLSVLAIIANACKNNDIAKYLNSLPHSERFVRHILAYLSDPDINFLTIVHSLQILVRLTVDDPMGQKFFKESNIDQIWRLLFSMMEKGSSYSLEPVLDLLEETMSIAKFRTSLENYVANTAYIKQALIDCILILKAIRAFPMCFYSFGR